MDFSLAAEITFRAHKRSMACILVKEIASDEVASFGSGFVVWSEGTRCLVLTAEHVVPESLGSETKIVARLFDADEEVDVKVLRRDVARDIALLELTTPGARPRLMLDERVAPPVGTVVVALAYFVPDTPEGVPFVYPDEPGSAPGKISSDPGQEFGKSTGKFAEVIAATCGTIQGCSGGPLILDHKVLGILTTGRHQVSVFVTARTVRSVFLGWLNHEEGDDGPSMEDLTRLLSGL